MHLNTYVTYMQLNRARVPGWYQYRRLRLRDIWWQRIRQYHILTYKNEQMFSETVVQSCLFKGCDLTRIYTTEKDTFFFTAYIWHLISNVTILIKQQTYFNLEMHENAAYERYVCNFYLHGCKDTLQEDNISLPSSYLCSHSKHWLCRW